MTNWSWLSAHDWSWLFTWRALLILGLPILWCLVAIFIGRRIEGRR